MTVAVCESIYSDKELVTELRKGYLGLQNSDRFGISVHWDARICSPDELAIIQLSSTITRKQTPYILIYLSLYKF